MERRTSAFGSRSESKTPPEEYNPWSGPNELARAWPIWTPMEPKTIGLQRVKIYKAVKTSVNSHVSNVHQ